MADPDSRLALKGDGKEAKLCYAMHILTENKHGLIVDTELTWAVGTAEPDAALQLVSRLSGVGQKTLDGTRVTRSGAW